MADHGRIWLSPRCPTCAGEDRTWCCNNEWPDGCDPPDCTVMPTEYVRADLACTQLADMEQQMLREHQAAVDQYAIAEALRGHVGRLEAAMRINGLRAGATHAQIDEWLAMIDRAGPKVTESSWQPIDTAPRDGTVVLVWATLPDHAQWTDPQKRMPPVMRTTAWHPDAGWCVDELREATDWRPLPAGPRCDAT